jgi:hypothetical protein
VTCSRCGEETREPADHTQIEDCLNFLRLSVTQLNVYVARASLESESARRQAAVLMDVLQEIAELARPDLDPGSLADAVRRIKKLAIGQAWGRGKSTPAP